MTRRRRFINPIKMGLLGGLGEWMRTMEKYNVLSQQIEGRKQAYKIKYDAQERMAQARAKANLAARLAAAEGNQKKYTVDKKNDDGSVDRISYINHMDPNDPSGMTWNQKELGRAPAPQTKAAGPTVKTFREGGMDVTKQWDPDKKEWVQMGSGPHFNPATANNQADLNSREQRRQSSLDARQVNTENAIRERTRAKMLEQAKTEWKDPDQRKQMLHEAGLDGMDPKDPDTRKKYLEWKASDLRASLPNLPMPTAKDSNGANAPGGAEDVSPPNVASDPQGRQREIRYDKHGQAYMMDKDGKPVPVHINDKGIAPDAPPLALEHPDSVSQLAAAGGGDDEEGETNPDDEDQEGEPSVAENEANDAEDENDDEQQFEPQQPRGGLMDQYG